MTRFAPSTQYLTRTHSSGPKGGQDRDEDGATNPGSNLFVTGIHPKLTEQEVTRLFEKYGEVEKCQIMRDPHSKESRGFGFVKMVTSEMADAAKDGLQGEIIEGRTLSIEKARRARPRTPTPGKYFGPPKRGEPIHILFVLFPLTNISRRWPGWSWRSLR
jgi:RNA recognition motif-containing protein